MKKGFNDWSPENITLFWDWLSSNSYLKDSYFSKQVGSGIFHLVKKQKKLEGDFNRIFFENRFELLWM